MAERTRREVVAAVKLWQRRLRLEHWEIEIDWDQEPPDDAIAAAWRSTHYELARLRFQSDWPTWSVRYLHQNVVHEMLHLAMRDVDSIADLIPTAGLRRDVDDVLIASYKHHSEGFVDHLARALVALAEVT
jgi:hypothetical protein